MALRRKPRQLQWFPVYGSPRYIACPLTSPTIPSEGDDDNGDKYAHDANTQLQNVAPPSNPPNRSDTHVLGAKQELRQGQPLSCTIFPKAAPLHHAHFQTQGGGKPTKPACTKDKHVIILFQMCSEVLYSLLTVENKAPPYFPENRARVFSQVVFFFLCQRKNCPPG